MAITINSKPAAHTPGYNPQLFVATSTNYNQTNFKYVVTVRAQSTATTAAIEYTEKYSPRPDNGKLYLDTQRLVDASIKNEFYPTITDFQFSLDGAIVSVVVGIDEEYGSPVSGFTGASGSYQAWNAAYTTRDFSTYTYAVGTASKDLTLAPSLTETININQRYLFKTWHRGFSSLELRNLQVRCYNSAGILIQHTTFLNQFWDTTLYRHNYIIGNMSPYALNNSTAVITYQLVATDVIPSNTSYYTLTFEDNTANISSNLYRVDIDSNCYKYDRYILHFLNRLGNYDSFTFSLLNRKTSNKKIQEYKKNPFELVSNVLTYYNYKSDSKNYSTTIINNITLNSDWITDAQATWLKELFNSPSVILEDIGNNLYAVKVTDTNYETKQKINDRIFNVTINLEYEYQDIRQRG